MNKHEVLERLDQYYWSYFEAAKFSNDPVKGQVYERVAEAYDIALMWVEKIEEKAE